MKLELLAPIAFPLLLPACAATSKVPARAATPGSGLALADMDLTADPAEDFYRFHDVAHAGRLGQRITVNGVEQPTHALQVGQRIRLRLINASNARIYQLALDGLPGWLIARDGVPAESSIAWDGPMLLGPGMRADMVIDAIRPGQFELRDEQSRGAVVLARLVVQGQTEAGTRPAPVPPPIEIASLLLPTSHATRIAVNGLAGEAIFDNLWLSFGALTIWAIAGYSLLLWRLSHRES